MLFLLAKVDADAFVVEVFEAGEEVVEEEEGADQALRLIVADGMEAVIPMRSTIDYWKERKRPEKQQAKAQKDLEGLTKRHQRKPTR